MPKEKILQTNQLLISKALNWTPSINQIEKFTKLQLLLRDWNRKTNLTRLTEGNDFWIGQVIDSLWPLKKELQNSQTSCKIIDVGSGCGLPGLAIAIALPNSSLTLVDSINRKTIAIKNIAEGLGLTSRVNVINKRIELLGQDSSYRNSFDLSLARAVASSEIVAEYLIPFLNNIGEALIYKGKWTFDEQRKLKKALILLKGEINQIQRFDLPENKGTRHIIRVKCLEKCPEKYPRGIGIPNKKPLGT